MSNVFSATKYRAFSAAGLPLAGGKVWAYVGGTSTLKNTYPTAADAAALSNPNTNPVILDANGEAQIWLTTGNYKFTLMDSNDVVQNTIDGINTGVSDPPAANWLSYTQTIAYVSATSFTVTGDVTSVYTVNRRLKMVNTGGTFYGTITASSYSAPSTTVTVLVDDGNSLDSGLSDVDVGIEPGVNDSIPRNLNLMRYRVETANYTATAGDCIAADTTAVGAWTLTLPPTASNGHRISVVDYAGSFHTATLTIGRNGHKIMGLSEDMTCRIRYAAFNLTYIDSTKGWELTQ